MRQQAEFLERQGRVDEAMDGLEHGIRGNPKNSPWLYLDLLGLLHRCARQREYRQFREQFIRLFNASVVEFSRFADEGKGLAAYPSLLQQLEAQMGSPQLPEALAACILRGAQAGPPVDLAAFRELLSLHERARKAQEVQPVSG